MSLKPEQPLKKDVNSPQDGSQSSALSEKVHHGSTTEQLKDNKEFVSNGIRDAEKHGHKLINDGNLPKSQVLGDKPLDKLPPPAKVDTDAEGHVTKVTYHDGKTRDFSYGADGQISKIVASSGDTFIKKDGQWEVQKKDGTTYNANTDSILVDSKGNLEWTFKDGRVHKVTTYGEYREINTITKPDGRQFELDHYGHHVLHSLETNGSLRTFTYNADGKPIEISSSDGEILKSDDNGENWTFTDGKDGNPIISWHGNVIVDKEGNYSYEEPRGGHRMKLNADGSAEETADDGKTTAIMDSDGKLFDVRNGKVCLKDLDMAHGVADIIRRCEGAHYGIINMDSGNHTVDVGIMQWNQGAGGLVGLMRAMDRHDHDKFQEIFGNWSDTMLSTSAIRHAPIMADSDLKHRMRQALSSFKDVQDSYAVDKAKDSWRIAQESGFGKYNDSKRIMILIADIRNQCGDGGLRSILYRSGLSRPGYSAEQAFNLLAHTPMGNGEMRPGWHRRMHVVEKFVPPES